MANKRFIVRHGLDNSGDNSVVNTIINVAEPVNNSDAATKYYVDTHTTGGTVTSVTATSPVESTGGTTPVISLGTGANGQLVIGTGTGFTKSTLTAGTGVSIANASGSITISATGSGGDVVGPASATDNAVTRFDSTTGKLIQNSTVTLDDNGNFGNVNSVVLDNTPATLPTGAGTMYWEDGEGTAEVILKGGNTTLKVGTQEYARVYNDSGSTITLGQVVYISGAQGNRIAVKLAQADVEANSFGALGLVAETIANGAEGWVIVSGALYKLNTNGLTAGAVVYLSPTTAGAYTTTKPQAPDQLVVLGFVERVSSTVGSIYVKVDNGYELDELHDVRITSPVSGNTLIYDATTSPTGVWKNASLTAGTGISVTNGAGSITIGNTGVTSVSGTSPVVSSGGATPAISLASGYGDTQNPYGSKTANYFLASPNGSAGVPTFRAIVAADIPTLNQSTTGNAATASALQTARNINGVSFNGTADITVTAAANTLTGTTLASGVTASSLTSVGTLGSLTVSGNATFDTNTLFVDATNDRVGVGTVSPSYKLDVRGMARIQSSSGYNVLFETWNTNERVNFMNDAGSANISAVFRATDYAWQNGGGSDILKLDSSGNLGVGTSSPSAKLQVVGTTKIGEGVASNSSKLMVNTVSGVAAGIQLFQDTVESWIIQNPASITALTFSNSGTERMRIDSSGNVGIGTSSPSGKLDVVGSGTYTVGGSRASLVLRRGATTGNQSAMITFGDSGGTSNWAIFNDGAANGANDFTIYDGVNGAYRLFINGSGNVGIGTSSPSTKLHVANGGSNAQATFVGTTGSPYITVVANSGTTILGNESNGGWVGTTGSQAFVFKTNDTERMRIDSNGNLLVGTTSGDITGTTTKISANGGTGFAATNVNTGTGTYSVYRLGNANNTNRSGIAQTGSAWTTSGLYQQDGMYIYTSGNGGMTLSVESNQPMYFATNNTERMRIDSSGNVGIGTSSPQGKLDIRGGDLVLDACNVGDERGIFFRQGFVSSDKYNCSILVKDHSGNFPDGLSINGYDGISFCTGSNTRNERMRLTETGNVGIGTTSPSEKLNVSGKIKASDVLLGNNGTKGYGAITTTTSTSTPTGGASGDHYYIY